ncbi:MAG: hypothetical protein P1U46_04095 [Patescibacteria group bacterium]|nr:hypothetical protein [Patescibacteria group bacterium]
MSLKSIDSSSTINAGSFFIPNSFFKFSSLVVSTFIKSDNPNSSRDLFTLSNSSLVFSSLQNIFTFIIFYYTK